MQINQPATKILTIGSVILLFFHGVNAPYWINAFLTVFLLIIGGREYGRKLLPNKNRVIQTIWGGITGIAIITLIRGAIFYIGGNANDWGQTLPTIITGIMSAIGLMFFPGQNQKSKKEIRDHQPIIIKVLGIIFPIISILIFCAITYLAYKSGTTESIRTPWPLMPEWTLPLIALQWMLLLAGTWLYKHPAINGIQLGATIGSITTLTPLLYRIGYGFDGFLHIAGERILLQTGTLSPKPMYYMGQYLFTTWLAPLFEIDISIIDRWLVPIASAILIPLALIAIINTSKNRTSTILASAVLIPLSAFVTTTPHGFAMILAISAIILAIGIPQKTIHPALPIILASWCVLTHPLVGLPILGTIIAITLADWKGMVGKILSIIIAILAGLSIPVVFGLSAMIGASGGVEFDLSAILNISAWKPLLESWLPWVQNRYALWPETSVWIEKLLPIAILLLALRGRLESLLTRQKTGPWLTASITTWLAACTLSIAGDFGFLIDYERGNYTQRLFVIALLLLLPLAIPELSRRFEAMKNGSRFSLVAVIVTIGITGSAISYAALPRHDAVTASRGWSVGLSDIEAVHYIDEDANKQNYTVLANQSVSAAAIRSFGFKRYNQDIFYYPIPTGGKLYEIFLEASYEDPSRKLMQKAGELGGSDIVYFVVNDYWWKADELIEKARLTADRVYDIGDGKVTVFRYDVESGE